MLIGREHRTWAAATAGVAGLATALFVAARSHAPLGSFGATPAGIAFGVAGTLLMAAAGLISVRKRHRTARVGDARTWMNIHLWGGALGVLLILFHSGFSLGGPLTAALMTVLLVIAASGVYGLVLQQFVPRLMTERLAAETVHGQIDHVNALLRADAYEVVAGATGPIAEAVEEQDWMAREKKAGWKAVPRREAASTPVAGADVLRSVYLQEVRPWLQRSFGASRPAPDLRAATIAAPPELHARLERLREICEESRQLELQRRLHGWLHNWLFLHAPLSVVLFVLLMFHLYSVLHY